MFRLAFLIYPGKYYTFQKSFSTGPPIPDFNKMNIYLEDIIERERHDLHIMRLFH